MVLVGKVHLDYYIIDKQSEYVLKLNILTANVSKMCIML